ncbi:hypothetical protein GCM10023220_32180 [Streptomyces ziwulingensis]|uniref:Uncharacterized protein n=1 Tax=Streptomyces ziwulingensis TaxID=1045501 RepID=A0ABP9BYT7_9ACTN
MPGAARAAAWACRGPRAVERCPSAVVSLLTSPMVIRRPSIAVRARIRTGLHTFSVRSHRGPRTAWTAPAPRGPPPHRVDRPRTRGPVPSVASVRPAAYVPSINTPRKPVRFPGRRTRARAALGYLVVFGGVSGDAATDWGEVELA